MLLIGSVGNRQAQRIMSWYEDVLSFWFDELSFEDWFAKSSQHDEYIAQRFASTHKMVAEQDIPARLDNAAMALAAVVVLDQFSRQLFRGTKQAFAYDALALQYADKAITADLHLEMDIDRQRFLYMPFMHSEDLATQARSVELFRSIGHPEHAEMHADIIKRFGRYPHRNAVLEREDTEAEREYLIDAKRFGQ